MNGDTVVRFFSNLSLVNKHLGKPFKLRPWQEEPLRTLYDTLTPEGLRQYQHFFWMLPRSSGKTELCAGLVLLHLIASDVGGVHIYSAASSRDQASQIYDYCYAMIRQDAYLSEHCKCLDSKRIIEWKPSGNIYKALSADYRGSHSIKPDIVIIDELHLFSGAGAGSGHRGRLLWDALHSGSGTIDEPLWLTITTAGFDKRSLCYEEYTKAKASIENPALYPNYLARIHEYQGEDWDNVESWKLANPALGDFVHMSNYEQLARDARELPSRQNSFRQLYLNTWTDSSVAWLDVSKWDECNTSFDASELDGCPCWCGMDLSSVIDLSAACLVFPWDEDKWRVLFFTWVNESNAALRTRRDNQPYMQWLKNNDLIGTPGNAIDYQKIRKDINKLGERFKIQMIGIDPWNATDLSQQLVSDGFHVEAYRQGFGSMNAPAKYLERLLLTKKLEH